MNKILLIENEDSGKYYKELVQKSIENVEIIWVKNRNAALSAFSNNSFKVVVYDQRLDNNELGIDIMLELKKKDKHLVGIMLSAYATSDDTAKAGKEGILFEFVNKNSINILPTKIIDALRYYDLNRALDNTQEKIFIGRLFKKRAFFHPLKYYIVMKNLVDSNYVFDESWEDMYMINAGEEQCQKKSIEITKSVKVVNTIKDDYKQEADFSKLQHLVALNFKNQVSISQSSEVSDCTKTIDEIVKTYKMPNIPQSVDEDYLTTTILQCGQIYKKYEVIISEECSLCNNNTYHHIEVFVPTDRKKLRKVNTYRFGNQEIVEVSARN